MADIIKSIVFVIGHFFRFFLFSITSQPPKGLFNSLNQEDSKYYGWAHNYVLNGTWMWLSTNEKRTRSIINKDIYVSKCVP